MRKTSNNYIEIENKNEENCIPNDKKIIKQLKFLQNKKWMIKIFERQKIEIFCSKVITNK